MKISTEIPKMGTHSLIIMRVKQDDETYRVWSVLYQQFDGYVQGVGLDLVTFLRDMKIVNGFDPYHKDKQANGPGCLFAQIISHFKKDVGGAYLEDPTDIELAEYNYYVDVSNMTINVKLQYGETVLHEGSPSDVLNKITVIK